ncbi:hypothetical protein GCM10010435_60430 [Winogradskya consettensis]|uniref:Fibronectin type-III domain-containing protein n=1 Tax=Winogradskya consettensis TaxID=113560 RepID=A0A919W1C4_9ACTN|nr:fibronectin type III domain-containing protein [Actinoplanes consettensis]GIM76378.1 hypothetical protein Aco04nite_50130 [Actinoplanes consettensis]
MSILVASVACVSLTVLPSAAPARADVRPAAGQFVPVTPVRIVNGGKVAPAESYSLGPLGQGGIPAAGVSAVAFQFSALSTDDGWLVVHASDVARPGASNLNYQAGVTATNQVVTGLGTDGKAKIYNGGAAQASLFVDVIGYFTTGTGQAAGSTFVPVAPARIASALEVKAKTALPVAPLGLGGVPATNVTGIVAHLTLSSTVAGQATVYASDAKQPATVDVTYGSDPNYTNLVHAPLGSDGRFLVYSTQLAKLTVDVVGYYQKPAGTAAGSSYVALTPARFIAGETVAANTQVDYPVAGVGGVPTSGVAAVVFNLTANKATKAGALSTWATGTDKPVARQLTYRVGGSWPTLQISKVGTGGKISLYNAGDAVRILGDIVGYYRAASAPGVPSGVRATAAGSGTATVSWDPPATDGGAAITRYTVTASPGGATASTPDDTTSVQVPGLSNGVAYTFSVTATNAAGTSAASARSAAVTPEAPVSPGQPFVTDVLARDGAVAVTWSPPPAGAATVTSYRLVATPGGVSAEAAGDLTEAILPGLTNGTAYRITVTATNGNGTGTPSAPSATVTPGPAQPPLRPAVTSVVALNQRVDLQWVAPPDGGGTITGYTVTTSPGAKVVEVPAGTTVASVTGLANGTPVTLAVTATNSAGAGPATQVTATPAASRAPAAPADLHVSATGAGQLTAAWSAPADVGTSAVTGYTVTASPGGATVTVGAATTTALLSGLSQATAYTVTVKATNAAGTGAASPASDPVTPKVTMAATPVVLTSASMATLRTAQQDGTLTFEQPTAQVAALKAGALLVLTPNTVTPKGFYGRVTSAVTRSGLFVVATAEAGLDEVFTAGGLSVDGRLTTQDVASFTPLVPGVRLAEPTIKGRTLAEGAPAVAIGTPDIGIRDGALVLEYAFAPQQNEAGRGARTEMQTKITPTYDGRLTYAFPIGPEGKFTLGAKTESQVQAKVGFSKDLLDWHRRLGTVRGSCVTVPIGFVPVVMCPEFGVDVAATITAGGGYSFSFSFDRSFSVSMNIDGTKVTPTTANWSDGSPSATINAFGDANAELDTPVSMTLYFYGAAGPSVLFMPYVRFFADTTQNPWWEARVGLRVNAELKSRKILGVTLEFSSPNIVNLFLTVAQAAGAYSGITVTPKAPSTSVNTPVDFGVTVVGWPADIPIEWAVTDGPGRIEQNGVFTSPQEGTAEITATSPGDPARLRPAMSATTVVSIGARAPDAPRDVTAVAGSFSAKVTWKAPADNGSPVTGYTLTTLPPTVSVLAPAGATTARLEHLNPGTDYLVYVWATNAKGTGPAGSPAQSVSPADDSFLPIGTQPVNITAADPAMSTLHWGDPVLSRTGRYVVYSLSPDSPLAPADLAGASAGGYLVRHDLVTGDIVLVSRGPDGVTPVTAGDPAIDGSGNLVSYLVGAGSTRRILVHDLARGTVTEARPGNMPAIPQHQELSADGTTLLVWAQATSTLRGSVWRSVIGSGTATQVSRCWVEYSCTSGPYVADGKRFAVSGNGRYIVYAEQAENGGLTNYLYDATTGAWKEMTPQTTDTLAYEVSAISADASRTAGFYGSYNTATGTYTMGAYVRTGRAGTPAAADIVLPVPGGQPVTWTVPQLSDDGSTALVYHESAVADGNDGFTVVSAEQTVTVGVPAQWGALSGDGRVVAVLREDQPGVWMRRVS